MAMVPVSGAVGTSPPTGGKVRPRPAGSTAQSRKKRRVDSETPHGEHTESSTKHEHVTQINTVEHALEQMKRDISTLMYAYGDVDQPRGESVDVVAHCLLNIVYGCLRNGVSVLSSSGAGADDVKLRYDVIQNNISLYSALHTENDMKQNEK